MEGLVAVRNFKAIFFLISSLYAMKFERFERDPSKDVFTCRGKNRVFYKEDCCRSVSQCLAICANDTHCNVVYYDDVLLDCFGCEIEDLLTLRKPVNRTFRFYRRIKSYMNLPCRDSTACGKNQMCEPASGICTCQPGYSYSHTMDTCSRGCLKYGGTYQKHEHRKITIPRILGHQVNSITECMDYCTKHPQCRSFNFKVPFCTLLNVTASTNPNDFFSSTTIDQYTRNCV